MMELERDDYDKCKATKEKVLDAIGMTDDELFKKFLRKVDRTSEPDLIKQLFGSEEAYIDSPGDYKLNPKQWEYDIIYCFRANAEDNLIRLFGWYCANWAKARDWVYCRNEFHKPKSNSGGKQLDQPQR
jgi:hypothetical protein